MTRLHRQYNIITYENADKFVEKLQEIHGDDGALEIKDDPFTLSIGFVNNDNWHKLHIKHCKGRKDIGNKLKKLSSGKWNWETK